MWLLIETGKYKLNTCFYGSERAKKNKNKYMIQNCA